jgi:hypothetical protein
VPSSTLLHREIQSQIATTRTGYPDTARVHLARDPGHPRHHPGPPGPTSWNPPGARYSPSRSAHATPSPLHTQIPSRYTGLPIPPTPPHPQTPFSSIPARAYVLDLFQGPPRLPPEVIHMAPAAPRPQPSGPFCVFRRKSTTHSNSNRPLIPEQIVH